MNTAVTKRRRPIPVDDVRAADVVLADYYDLIDLIKVWPHDQSARSRGQRSRKVRAPATPSAPATTAGSGKPLTWSVRGSKGPVPGWVLNATGAKNKHQVAMLFDPDAIFTMGGKLPRIIGERSRRRWPADIPVRRTSRKAS